MKPHIFQRPFDEEEFKEFLETFIPQLTFSSSRNEARTGFDFVRQIGEARGSNLDLVVFVAKPKASINARVDITKNTYAFLKTHARSNALVAYVSQETSEWRFSLITTKVTRTSGGVKETVSNPRRFSYVLGPGAKVLTPIKMLQESVSSIKELEDKFSLAVVSKEFYTRIAVQYSKLVGGTRGEGRRAETYERKLELGSVDDTVYANFAIRLIGRLVFCWFLKQKKGSQHVSLIPDELLSAAAVSKNADYYHSLCAPLFFEVLNKPINSRPSFFAHSELFDKVPFLNGGLFQDHAEDNHKFNRTTGLSERRGVVAIPDTWFAEMFGIFEEYNFTIDENTSIDTELSIDPEMLGRIFENLLAEVNPETGASARKATGSFYTPREIVDFMVEESLVAHLKTKTGISEEKLRVLSSYDLEDDARYPFANDEKKMLVDAIHNTAVLDPACGSGAFPIGVLQRMVHMLGVLDPDCSIYLNKFPAEARRQLQKHNLTYVRKLGVIRECIHGIDIQPVATDISRLRCFLTLVVDQQVDDNAPNRGIEPLPNLDFKFVCANTLIKPPVHEGPLFGDEFATALGELIDEYFAPVDQVHKLETARKLQQLISEKTKKELESIVQSFSGIKDKNHKRLLAKKKEAETGERMRINELWGSYENIFQNKPVGFFDTRYFFPNASRQGGFDIVIGNPPYVSTKGADEVEKELRFQQYGFADDLYSHFTFRGFELLSEGGVLAYITSNTFWTIQTKKNMRDLLLANDLLELFDTANPFEAAMIDTSVVIARKSESATGHIRILDGTKSLLAPIEYRVRRALYADAVNHVLFLPTEFNLQVYEKYNRKVKDLLGKWWESISTSKKIADNAKSLEKYRQSLMPGDVTLLGLVTEGGQGLATGDNGSFVGALEGTPTADRIYEQRPLKFFEAITSKSIKKYSHIQSQKEASEFLKKLSEIEIRELFDDLVKGHGKVFGKGFLYRIVQTNEVADISALSREDRGDGISGARSFVPYDKGDKEGNRWYLRTPYYIDWSEENVEYLKQASEARFQGYQFFFRAGFCWNDVLNPNARLIKTRIKEKSVNDVKSMSLYKISDQISDKLLVCLLNSNLLFDFYRTFINSSVSVQINDVRQLPIIIPSKQQLARFENIFDEAYEIQEQKFDKRITENVAKVRLDEIQVELDRAVYQLYDLVPEEIKVIEEAIK